MSDRPWLRLPVPQRSLSDVAASSPLSGLRGKANPHPPSPEGTSAQFVIDGAKDKVTEIIGVEALGCGLVGFTRPRTSSVALACF